MAVALAGSLLWSQVAADAQTAQLHCCHFGGTPTPAPTPTPLAIPTLLLAAGIIQPAASHQPDPGATFVTTAWAAVDYNQEPLVTGTCTTNASLCYGYESFALNQCNTATEGTVWGNMTEPMFTHEIGGGITAGNRLPNPNSPTATPCPSPGPHTTNGGNWNPAGSSLAGIVNTAWAANRSTLKLFEDNSQITGEFQCGSSAGAGWITSTEYGMGQQSGNTWRCDLAATNAHAQGIDYDTAVGQFAANLTPHVWFNGLTPCCGNVTGCTKTTSGKCHDPFYGGGVNNAWAIHNICANAGGQLDYFLAENPLLHKYNGATWPLANGVTMTWFLNTIANLYKDSSCNGTNIVHFEYGSGTGGPGDLAGGIAVRPLFAAFDWLVANPSTTMPDRVLPEFAGISCASGNPQLPTNNPCVAGQVETPYFFEETFVPVGAEQSVAAYSWGGISTTGSGCPTNGDTGGAIALLVQCVGTAGIYCQQYPHLYINATDTGPMMACVNTSGTPETVQSGWAIHDPISSYNSVLSLSGGDLTAIPYGLTTVPTGCTYTVVCTGDSTLSDNLVAFTLGTTTIPASGGIILTHPTAPPSPSPSPSPTPTPGAATYTYQGCQVYNGTAGTADPIANALINALAIDSNSATVIAAVSGNITFSNASNSSLEIVNLANNATGLFTVGTNGGHNPPITKGANPPNYGGAGAQVPWIGGSFALEGTNKTTSCSGDCHWTTLNTQTCFVYEGGGGHWTGSAFNSFNGLGDTLAQSYTSQWPTNKGDNWSVAGIPGLGFTNYGEDASLTSINHPVQVIIPTNSLLSGTHGVNYAGGTGDGGGSCSGASTCLELGDIIRLKSTDSCANADAQVTLFCNQLKNYGGVIADTGSTPTFRFGLSASGANPWHTAVFTYIHTLTLSNDFDIINRSALVP